MPRRKQPPTRCLDRLRLSAGSLHPQPRRDVPLDSQLLQHRGRAINRPAEAVRARLRWNGLEILDPAVRGAAAAGRDVELRQEPRGDVTDGRESEDRGLLLGVGANVP